MTSSQKINIALESDIPVIQLLEAEAPPQEDDRVWRERVPFGEQWDMSGATFAARALNSARYFLEWRTTLDCERESCSKFYEQRPRTGWEHTARAARAFGDIDGKLGRFAAKIVADIQQNMAEYRTEFKRPR